MTFKVPWCPFDPPCPSSPSSLFLPLPPSPAMFLCPRGRPFGRIPIVCVRSGALPTYRRWELEQAGRAGRLGGWEGHVSQPFPRFGKSGAWGCAQCVQKAGPRAIYIDGILPNPARHQPSRVQGDPSGAARRDHHSSRWPETPLQVAIAWPPRVARSNTHHFRRKLVEAC